MLVNRMGDHKLIIPSPTFLERCDKPVPVIFTVDTIHQSELSLCVGWNPVKCFSPESLQICGYSNNDDDDISIKSYTPFVLYPRRGSRGISDILPTRLILRKWHSYEEWRIKWLAHFSPFQNMSTGHT
jgi:hypothetical protein